MDWILDERTRCYSIMVSMTMGDYLKLVETAHAQRGGIAGQRDVLKTTTAKRIRDRMVDDIRAGAVLPPVVLGVVMDGVALEKIAVDEWKDIQDLLAAVANHELTIIDGMQRTAGLFEATGIDSGLKSRNMRVEFWVATSVRSLIYRMLILNTAQVPWTLARQLSVVYAPLLKEISINVPSVEKIFTPDKPGRRSTSGQFNSDALVELYMAFSLRKSTVDTKETLSEEFSRLDFVDNLADAGFQDHFYTTLSLLIEIDKRFERYSNGGTGRFSRGKDIFGSQPARIGFIVAIAQNVLGRPGQDRVADDRTQRIKSIVQAANAMLQKLDGMTPDEVGKFIKLDVLSEILNKRVGQVGRHERNIFLEAFKVLVDEQFALPDLEPCWRAS